MDICAAIQDFFKLGVVLQCLNSDLVVLLPNVLGAFSITQFQSITLRNFLFKIIIKFLASRQASILDKLIILNQCDFLKRRQTSSCILAASECVNMLDKRMFGMVIDFTKAFETTEWPLIFF